ncbi:MAG: GreA/GreB family elongation factor [Bacteroidetes bacterium]|nr:GreA/GreB family elongation factor [Bacteroidota bacterium]
MAVKLTLGLKKVLFQHCMDYVDEKIESETQAIKDAQDAANEETKSSAGDKYETTRAMMHLEEEKYATQLIESIKLKKVLSQIDIKKEYNEVQPGCVVTTNIGNYFLAISAGEIMVEKECFKAISLAAPIGQALNKAKVKDEITFRDKTIVIKSII